MFSFICGYSDSRRCLPSVPGECVHGGEEKPFENVAGNPQTLMWNVGVDGKSCFYSLMWIITRETFSSDHIQMMQNDSLSTSTVQIKETVLFGLNLGGGYTTCRRHHLAAYVVLVFHSVHTGNVSSVALVLVENHHFSFHYW